MKENLMIDIETLGVKPGCVVLSIGAVEFDSNGLGEMFYDIIEPETCTDWGLVIEPRTTMWWMDQPEAARKALTNAKRSPLDAVLKDFIAKFRWRGKKVWANGAAFDFPILEAAFQAVGLKQPWEYWGMNCYRTLKNLVPRDVYESCKVEPTVAHDALADACAQAETIIGLLAWVNRNDVKETKRAKRA